MVMNDVEGALMNHMQQLATNNNVLDNFVNQSKAPKVRAFLAQVIFLVLRTSPLQPVTANSSHMETAPALQWSF